MQPELRGRVMAIDIDYWSKRDLLQIPALGCKTLNIDIDHGAGYGQTIFVEAVMPGPPGQQPRPRKMASWWQVATVQWDLDLPKFYEQFFQLMNR